MARREDFSLDLWSQDIGHEQISDITPKGMKVGMAAGALVTTDVGLHALRRGEREQGGLYYVSNIDPLGARCLLVSQCNTFASFT